MLTKRRSVPLLAASLAVLVTGACSAVEDPPDAGSASETAASDAATPTSSASASASPSPSASPVEGIPDDQVVPGCPDELAEELGDVVGGVDVDGDGEKDVIRYIAGEDGAEPGQDCARTVVAYLRGEAAGQLAGFTLAADVEMPDSVESLQPGGVERSAYVSFRTTAADGSTQPHLLALDGGSPDLRLNELSLEGDGEPLLPASPASTPGVRAGFLCADGDLVAQVGAPRADGAATVWDVTTTTYRLQNREADVAVPVDETTQTGVADDALRFGYPALVPESTADLCS